MNRNAQLIWGFGIASLALLVAIAVYLLARIYPPEILAPFQSTDTSLATHTGIFGSAPSFIYTLALGLFIGVCVPTLTSARVYCLAWIGLALCLEISQYPSAVEPLLTWLYNLLPEPVSGLVEPYWSRGVFDPLDLLATLIGGAIALVLLDHLPKGNNDEIAS